QRRNPARRGAGALGRRHAAAGAPALVQRVLPALPTTVTFPDLVDKSARRSILFAREFSAESLAAALGLPAAGGWWHGAAPRPAVRTAAAGAEPVRRSARADPAPGAAAEDRGSGVLDRGGGAAAGRDLQRAELLPRAEGRRPGLPPGGGHRRVRR